jgi:Predicted ATPase related to phosphate starvation-inducible protein PhoH
MTGSKRIYALDTNVLLHDPTSLFRFEEHDVFIPMTVLEELDEKKKAPRKFRATPARSAAFSTSWSNWASSTIWATGWS